MGWTFIDRCRSKQDIIDTITNDLKGDSNVSASHMTVVGKCLWALCDIKKENNAKAIILFLLDKQDGSWGYKDMDESMGPFFYSCPLKYLPLATIGVKEEWRQNVRAFHEKKKVVKGFAPGMEMSVSGNWTISGKVIRKAVLKEKVDRLWSAHIFDEAGDAMGYFRIPNRMLKAMTAVEKVLEEVES